MTTIFKCQNGHQMQSPGSPPGTQVSCPTCKVIVVVPQPSNTPVMAYPVEGATHAYQGAQPGAGYEQCPPHRLVPSDEISLVAWGICLCSGCWCFCPLFMEEFKKKRCMTCNMRFEMWESTNVRPPPQNLMS
eukprot:g75062.t1